MALVKVKAPASVLRLIQRWHERARSALISTTRPSVTSKQAMPMFCLQCKPGGELPEVHARCCVVTRTDILAAYGDVFPLLCLA